MIIIDKNKSILISSDISKFREEITKQKIQSTGLYNKNISIFEQIKIGLNQAILYEYGKDKNNGI